MESAVEYERPNTVSGLNAKRKALAKLLGKITAEAERVRTSIKHIDACVACLIRTPSPYPPCLGLCYDWGQLLLVSRALLRRYPTFGEEMAH